MTRKNGGSYGNFCAARNRTPLVNFPFDIVPDSKWGVLVGPVLADRLPKVEFDKIEINRNERDGGYWLRLYKNGRMHELAVRDFPDLTELEMATIVLFAG